MGSQLSSFAKVASGALAALGIGAAVKDLTRLATETAKTSKELANFANIAGSTAIEFKAYASATGEVGISSEKLADISKDTLEKLGEYSATKGGGFLDFFNEVGNTVGITAESLLGLSGPAVLGKVVAAMEAANIPLEQQSFYLESIASDSTRLIPILKDLGNGVDGTRARFESLNSTMSQGVIETYIDLEKAQTSLSNNFGILIANSLEPTSELFTELSNSVNEYLTAVNNMDKATATAASSQSALSSALQAGDINAVKNIVEETTAANKVLSAEIERQTKLYEDNKDAGLFGQGNDSSIRATQALHKLGVELKAVNAVNEDAITNFNRLNDELSKSSVFASNGELEAKFAAEQSIRVESATTATDKLEQQYILDATNFGTSLDAQVISKEAYNAKILSLQSKLNSDIAALSVEPSSSVDGEDTNDFVFGITTASSWLESDEGMAYQKAIFERETLDEEYRKNKQVLDAALTEAGIDLNSSLIDTIAGMNIQLNEDSSDLTKALFIGQQAAAIANGIMNTEAAAIAALAVDPTGSLSTATRIQGYAGVATIAAQTLGQFHDGSDEIADTGSYILKQGEAVLQPEANKDLRTFLKDPEAAGGGGGNSSVVQNVNISGSVTDQAWFAQELAKSADQIAGIVSKKSRQYSQRR